ncbi:MAG: 50S ribosomal protein L11 methyltransferase [Deltaproteobacteria bacterium]|jgi:ribosomal protein L11 methyltransferase|nr:50S ribosomal protein L11 methyltransferase [Deltaproteobacteria bacterium]
MTDENWLSVTFSAPPIAAEALSGALFEAGAQSVWEGEPDPEGRAVLSAAFGATEAIRLMADLPRALQDAAEAFGLSPQSFGLSMTLIPVVDWEEEWKKDLAPIRVDDALILAPTWWEGDLGELKGNADPPPRILRIDPGAAFGSGRHPTTFLCLKLLAKLQAEGHSFARILDIGAGSGVLALAAALLFPDSRAVGVDSDAATVEVAEGNKKENGLGDRAEFSARPLTDLNGDFDLALANITLNPLLELAPRVAAIFKKPGRLIVSGLIESQVQEISAKYQSLGFHPLEFFVQGEWAALLLARVSDGPLGADVPLPAPQVVPEPSLETKPGRADGPQS